MNAAVRASTCLLAALLLSACATTPPRATRPAPAPVAAGPDVRETGVWVQAGPIYFAMERSATQDLVFFDDAIGTIRTALLTVDVERVGWSAPPWNAATDALEAFPVDGRPAVLRDRERDGLFELFLPAARASETALLVRLRWPTGRFVLEYRSVRLVRQVLSSLRYGLLNTPARLMPTAWVSLERAVEAFRLSAHTGELGTDRRLYARACEGFSQIAQGPLEEEETTTALYYAAFCAARTGPPERALELLHAMRRSTRYPGPDSLNLEFTALVVEGELEEAIGNLQNALDCYQRAWMSFGGSDLAHDPDFALDRLARLCFYLGRFELLDSVRRAAGRRNPGFFDRPPWGYRLAAIPMRRERWREAEVSLGRFVQREFHPGGDVAGAVQAMLDREEALRHLGRSRESLALLQHIVRTEYQAQAWAGYDCAQRAYAEARSRYNARMHIEQR